MHCLVHNKSFLSWRRTFSHLVISAHSNRPRQDCNNNDEVKLMRGALCCTVPCHTSFIFYLLYFILFSYCDLTIAFYYEVDISIA